MASKQRARRWTLAACLVVIVIQAIALATIALRGDAHEPHRVPLLVAAPAVVAASLAHDADAMSGTPFDASWTDGADEARSEVLDGTVVAAVLVDLRRTRDVVLVNARADDRLNDAVVDRIAAVSRTHDRTVTVEEVARAGSAGAASRVRWFAALCALLGFGSVLGMSLATGPAIGTGGRGTRRLLGLAGVAVAGATLLQLLPWTRLPGDDLSIIGLGALYVFTMGVITLAVEALAGLVGLAAAVATYLVLATPMLTGTSYLLLPTPWPAVTPRTPTGAAQAALADAAYFGRGVDRSHVLVVVAGALVGVVTVVLAHRMRGPSQRSGTVEALPVRHWRVRVLGAVLPLAALAGLAVAVVPTDVVATPPLPSVATQTTCVDRGGRPSTLAELNDQIATLQGTPAFRGGDVGADARLGDGRLIVVFGDTLRGEDFDGPRFARNSMLLWDTDCVSVVLPPSRGALIPDRSDGVGYWPMSTTVAHRPGYDLVLVSAQRVEATGAGSFDFANLGTSLAVFVVAEGGTPQLIAVEDIGPDDPRRVRPEWGAAMAVDDDWLYLYGTANPDEEGVFGFSLQVGRVRPDDVLDASAWRFWDGSTWQRDARDSAQLVGAVEGVSQTLSVFHRGGRWYALSKQDGDLGDHMAFWTAPRATGPFTPTAPVADLPADPDTGAITYMPLAHPGILPRRGTIVTSYSNNNTDPDKIKQDPTLYRPTFLRVPLPR